MEKQVVSVLGLDSECPSKVIAIKETGIADSSFLIASVIADRLAKRIPTVLILFHNTKGHYDAVLRRFGVDLADSCTRGQVRIVELPRALLASGSDFACGDSSPRLRILRRLCRDVTDVVSSNAGIDSALLVDDLSHIIDAGLDLRFAIQFLKECMRHVAEERVNLFLANCHTSTKSDELLSIALMHVADVQVRLSSLKTGRSRDVTGSLKVIRADQDAAMTYHYKVTERNIQIFAPGEAFFQ